MNFRTELTVTHSPVQIDYSKKMLLLGSCFSEHIGNWLDRHFMDVMVNPFGILYNPASIARSLKILLDEKEYTASDLFEHNGYFHSFDHHSRFSETNQEAMLNHLNQTRKQATKQLLEADILLITFGTAWVYTKQENEQVVSNCHKLPDKLFARRRMEIEEIVSEWKELSDRLFQLNPRLNIIFTVSPIRHLKDTLHGNQLSKSTLLLAIDQLQHVSQQMDYFPAYELLTDDLRDYRFYASDMVHPSETAILYIQKKFADSYFPDATKKLFSACEKIRRALDHRPSDENSDNYKRFLTQNIEMLNQLIDKNPFFTLRKPLQLFQERLK
ncbi:MAG: GSCFA domain-containing protein [Bacteroidales bacterium]